MDKVAQQPVLGPKINEVIINEANGGNVVSVMGPDSGFAEVSGIFVLIFYFILVEKIVFFYYFLNRITYWLKF